MELSQLRARAARKAENEKYLEEYQQVLVEAKANLKRHEAYMIEKWGDVHPILPCQHDIDFGKDGRKWRELSNKVKDIETEMKPLVHYIDTDDIDAVVEGIW